MPNIKEKFKYLFSYFLSPKEILFVFLLIFLSLFFFLNFLYKASALLMTERIKYSGNITEGVIGNLKEPNPYKPGNQADEALDNLLYSSLVQNNELKLIDKIDISADKNVYRVTLRKNIYFSDGSPITTDDVIYSLSNVAGEKDFIAEKTTDDILTFKLKKTDNDFLNKLTFPITKKDTVFENSFSTNLVTSSFFKIKTLDKDADSNVNSIIL